MSENITAIADSTRCKATTNAGTPCKAAALHGGDFCYWHDPEIAEQRKANNAKGGGRRNARAAEITESNISLRTTSDLLALLELTATGLQAMEATLSRYKILIHLVSVAHTIVKDSEFERRIDELERMVLDATENNTFEADSGTEDILEYLEAETA